MYPTIDLRFSLRGTLIPADHAYLLYGAVSSLLPGLHDEEEQRRTAAKHPAAPAPLGIHPISGQLSGQRRLHLTKHSALTLRVPSGHIAPCLALAGQTLRLGPDTIIVGVPHIRILTAAPALQSRLVIIKGATTPEALLEKARRDLAALGLTSPEVQAGIPLTQHSAPRDGGQGRPLPPDQAAPPIRRTLRISGREIIGFPLRITGLSAEESLLLQARGLGGRRHFGCGIFLPVRETESNTP